MKRTYSAGELWCGWGHSFLGVGIPLDVASLDKVCSNASRQGGKKVHSQLQAHTCTLRLQVLGIVKHAQGVHRPSRDLARPRSLSREVNPWYILTRPGSTRRRAVS